MSVLFDITTSASSLECPFNTITTSHDEAGEEHGSGIGWLTSRSNFAVGREGSVVWHCA